MAPKASARATVEETVVLVLFDLANQLSKLGENLAARADLTAQQWLVLLQVGGDPNFSNPDPVRRDAARGVMASEIADARGVSRATISVLVSQLTRKGLIRQEAHPGDRRRKGLFLTGQGRAALTRLEASRRDANRLLLGHLSDDERRTLLTALQGSLRQLWLTNDAGRIVSTR
jgi:DNA-binding MarR family transcriptional regulator